MEINPRDTVSSNETVSSIKNDKRLKDLEDWGVDLSLVWSTLQFTPTERVERMIGLLDLTEELQKGYNARLSANSSEN